LVRSNLPFAILFFLENQMLILYVAEQAFA